MKKFMSLFLAMILSCSLIIPAMATSASNQNRTIDNSTTKMSVETVDAIFAHHATAHTANVNVISEAILPSSEIDEELSHIYLDIYYAEENFSSVPTPENKSTLTTLIDRKDFLEQTMEQRGFIFLSDAEAQSMLGDVSGADGTPPPNTQYTSYVASPYKYVTLSDGSKVKYFYVTAYAQSPYSNMVRQTVVQLSKRKSVIGDFLNSVIQTYVGKIIGSAVSLIPGASWAPYEMLSPGVSNDITCDYSIKATYTTTPRFIWSLSDSLHYYLLDGVTHQTKIEDHHMIVYTKNGASHTDDHNVYYTKTTDGWTHSDSIVKNQWETYAPKPHFEYAENVDYYHKFDKNDPDSEQLVASEKVPYAISYMDMN